MFLVKFQQCSRTMIIWQFTQNLCGHLVWLKYKVSLKIEIVRGSTIGDGWSADDIHVLLMQHFNVDLLVI
ncbi:hypothetical protein MKW98_026023 [Papaver atlanticum]|uniref:Uncharacterized protein n=1 Tax=Papaver atlanticum TaxID=357466 RepID=A0AAD4RXX6_9MAGN|nr:hypothetical protein MKW98_026023 [Papaver atlanticum]